jgi:hypothetical protein
MKPIVFKEANTVFAEHQPEYQPLPAYRGVDMSGSVTSCWRLSFWERLRVLFKGDLWITMLTFHSPLQPLRPSVEKPNFRLFNY